MRTMRKPWSSISRIYRRRGCDERYQRQPPELLAPAGDMECLCAALDFGADAVYLAGQMFGMRTAPSNFTREELQTAVALAHARGVRVYVTCNTVPRNKEIDLLPDYLAFLQEAGVDALIVTDLGVIDLAKRYAPKVELHVSTQGRHHQLRGGERLLPARRQARGAGARNDHGGDRGDPGENAEGSGNRGVCAWRDVHVVFGAVLTVQLYGGP